ncbi:MAG: 1-deoxy-D-xylulose-5-phosphate synthase, partial [Bacteroidia bacterium]|nr:1-deoxy-D-xylulose-5-phosphate synthase [Bacteroidia bacterium]
CIKGGFGSAILEFAASNNYKNKMVNLGIPDQFIEHGNTEELFESVGLAPNDLAKTLSGLLS